MIEKKLLNAGRFALGSAAKLAGAFPSFDRKYHVNARLEGPWPQGPSLWLHGASLGECKVLLNLAKLLRRDVAQCPKILLTTQKVEVVPVLKKMGENVVDVSIAPADAPAAMSKFVRNVQPLALVLAENELWPGYLSAMAGTSLKPSVALVSGRFRRSFPGVDFSAVGLACMQTEADSRRLLKNVVRPRFKSMVGGDWKILDLLNRKDSSVETVASFEKDFDLAVLSAHFAEWESLAEILRVCKLRDQSVVLMPRRLEEVELFRHELRTGNFKIAEWPSVRAGGVTLINRFGLTSQVLERSRCALVGGSFCPRPGIHDFWEPLLANVPTFVGPHSFGHEDLVNELVQRGVLSRLESPSEFENLDLVSEEQIQDFLWKEKEKISSSYQRLLRFLEDVLK